MQHEEHNRSISFIIVNYNTLQATRSCIDSVAARVRASDLEVIVVDNASTDGSKEFFSSVEMPFLKYLYNDENVGFGAACNRGFSISKGSYVFLLNSDAVLQTDLSFFEVDEVFRANPDVGIVGAQVRFPDGSSQPSYGKFSTPQEILFRVLRLGALYRRSKLLKALVGFVPFKPDSVRRYVTSFGAPEQKYVDWVSGCAAIIKRKVFEAIGGFNERFFLYAEDEDFCHRALYKSYRSFFYPKFIVSHVLGGSSQPVSGPNPVVVRSKLDSDILLFATHNPGDVWKVKLIYLLTGCLLAPFSRRGRLILAHAFKRL